MTPADTFRRSYLDARAAGYSGSKRDLADLVLATALFQSRIRAATVAWVNLNPEPERRRYSGSGGWHGWTRADDDGPRLRVVRDEPADWLLGHLGLDGDPDAG